MANRSEKDAERLKARQARLDYNIFSRLPAVYAASRLQGQQLLQAGGGLKIVEWRVLWDLYEIGPMTIRELSALQRSDHSLLSRALPDMRRKGFVTMKRDEIDGRQTIVDLAPDGRVAYHKAAPVMARRRAALREQFNEDEIEEFVSYLDRLDGFLRLSVENILDDEATQ